MDDILYLNTNECDNTALVSLVRQTIEQSAHLKTKRVGTHTVAIEEVGGPKGWIQGLDKEYEEADTHSFEVGDYAIDDTEPTASPEANTVKIVELIDKQADEFYVDATGKTIAEHNPHYPDDDLVVAGKYPNMGNPDKVWHFPESRLRKV